MSPPSSRRTRDRPRRGARDRTSRRTVLSLLGTAASAAVAGCLGGVSPVETTERTDEPARTGASERTEDAASRSGGTADDATATDGAAGEPPTAATPSESPREGPDPFYVENHRPEDRCVSLSVRRTDGDETVLDGTYAVSGAKGIAFSEVGAVGESYAVEARLDTGESVDEEWTVRVCPAEFRGDGLDRAGLLRIDEEVRFVTNQCDFVVADRPETYEWDPDPSDCSV